jgi:hypothetical protein
MDKSSSSKHLLLSIAGSPQKGFGMRPTQIVAASTTGTHLLGNIKTVCISSGYCKQGTDWGANKEQTEFGLKLTGLGFLFLDLELQIIEEMERNKGKLASRSVAIMSEHRIVEMLFSF